MNTITSASGERGFGFRTARVVALGIATGAAVTFPAVASGAAARNGSIEITATPTSLQASSPSYKAGWTKVTLTNNDRDSHQAALIRLPKNTTVAAFTAKFAAEGPRALAGSTSSGGPAVAGPGRSSSVTVNLAEGTYLAADLVPGPDGRPKAARGFLTSFTVKRGLTGATVRPKASATVELHDFLFKGQISIKQGSTVAVRNDGTQPHELVMFGIAPGKTAKDVIDFLTGPTPVGPPPFTAAAGVAGIAPKAIGYLDVEVPAGPYVFLCFLPDVAGGGEPHFAKGMVAEGEVIA